MAQNTSCKIISTKSPHKKVYVESRKNNQWFHHV